jgi:hypothetical protein
METTIIATPANVRYGSLADMTGDVRFTAKKRTWFGTVMAIAIHPGDQNVAVAAFCIIGERSAN